MANQEHLAILKQGVDIWNKWKGEHLDLQPDLSGADLAEGNFRSANFWKVDFRGANLSGSDLHGANLRSSHLHGINLKDAYLRMADLTDTDLST
jgi:uncharacterized protein YjbI with pentapeptide repeats